jgi:glutamine synthetase type III
MHQSQAVGSHITARNAMLKNIILKITEELEAAVSKGTFIQTSHSRICSLLVDTNSNWQEV